MKSDKRTVVQVDWARTSEGVESMWLIITPLVPPYCLFTLYKNMHWLVLLTSRSDTARSFWNSHKHQQHFYFKCMWMTEACLLSFYSPHLLFMGSWSKKQQRCKTLPMRSYPSGFTLLSEEWEQHRNGGVNVPCHSRSFSMGRRDERHSLKVLYVQQQSL